MPNTHYLMQLSSFISNGVGNGALITEGREFESH